MSTLGDLLERRKDTIVERWVDEVLSAYPADGAALLRQQRDPFANPLGHGVREGSRGIFGYILGGMSEESLREHLDQILRIRAVQELTPSQAVSFVFSLRLIVREVIPEAEAETRHRDELMALDRTIDQVAMAAFDLYTARREELNRIRINEVKRQVAWVFYRMNRKAGDSGDVLEDPNHMDPELEYVEREDL